MDADRSPVLGCPEQVAYEERIGSELLVYILRHREFVRTLAVTDDAPSNARTVRAQRTADRRTWKQQRGLILMCDFRISSIPVIGAMLVIEVPVAQWCCGHRVLFRGFDAVGFVHSDEEARLSLPVNLDVA